MILTLTACQLEVFDVQSLHQILIAAGQQMLICMTGRAELTQLGKLTRGVAVMPGCWVAVLDVRRPR